MANVKFVLLLPLTYNDGTRVDTDRKKRASFDREDGAS
jgi:hypothetical protein